MISNKPPIVKLSIHLIREDLERIESFLSRNAKPEVFRVRFNAGEGQLLVQKSLKDAPKWAKFFSAQVQAGAFGGTAYVSAVLLLQVKSRWFAITFGPAGRHLIDQKAVVERFGLLVVLNSIPENQVRSMDKTAFDALATHSRVQTSRATSPMNFGFDAERDLVSEVVGTPSDELLGQRLHGRDALGTHIRIELEELPDLLARYLKRHQSKKYKAAFPWVDHIAGVKDVLLRKQLDRQLVGLIQREQLENCWLAVPEIVNWDEIDGFRYGRYKRNPSHHDLDLRAWLTELRTTPRKGFSATEIDLRLLETRRVLALDDQGVTKHKWSIYKCLNAEIEGDDGAAYLLSAGKWFRVARNFVQATNDYFDQLPRFDRALPEYCHEGEGSYNKSVAHSDPDFYALMDNKHIMFGGGPNRIEFCDLYTKDRDLIHVKRYGGSSVFSHLFAQGTVSGELFRMEPDFRRLVSDKLPLSHRIDNHRRQPDRDEYRIVFAVVSKQTGVGLSLPFFSRLNLRSAARRLQAYGYRVAIAKIPVEPEFAVTTRFDS